MKQNNKSTKRALIASIVSIILCMAMMMGATFAWFTDSVSSGKNTITAGNLDISATYQDVDDEGSTTYTLPDTFTRSSSVTFSAAKNEINKDTAIISEDLWEPGAVGAKLITVTNNGSLAATIKLDFTLEDTGLQNALWYDFVKVNDTGVVGTFTKRAMSTLESYTEKITIDLDAKESVSFILFYGMNEEAGNEYQGKTFSAYVDVLATQADGFESDSFGDDYDESASYPTVATRE